MAQDATTTVGEASMRPESAAAGSRRAVRAEGGAVRVLCVDDHALLAAGLRAQFELDPGLEWVGWLPSAEDLLDTVARERPDVVLLDVEMPGPDAFEMADRLHHVHPDVRCVFLTAHVRQGHLTAAYRCGASAYFAKSDDPEEIVAGIKRVAERGGGTFEMGPKVARLCAPSRAESAAEAAPETPLGRLTTREVEVLRLIGKGRSRQEIARELCRSTKTIDGHQERIRKKLGMSSRADLMRFAIREGLCEA